MDRQMTQIDILFPTIDNDESCKTLRPPTRLSIQEINTFQDVESLVKHLTDELNLSVKGLKLYNAITLMEVSSLQFDSDAGPYKLLLLPAEGCSDPKEMLQYGSKRASTQELYDEGCTSFRRYLSALRHCLSNIRAMYYMYLEGEQAGAKRFVDQVLRLIDQPNAEMRRRGRIANAKKFYQHDLSCLRTMLNKYLVESGSMSEQIDLEFEVIHQDSASSAPPHRLADSMCCLDRVLSDDARDCFPIYVEIPDHADPTKRSIATGAIFYFPNQGNKDTVPYVDELHGHSSSLDRRFMVFWMGRWLPEEDFVPGFMRYREGDKPLAPQRCYARTFGILFVDRGIEPEANKLALSKSAPNVKKMKEAIDSKDLAKAYDYWLKECHLKFDAEVSFEDENPKYIDAEGMSQHDKIIFCDNVYKVGEFVELYKESKEKAKIESHIGRIERFLQDKHFDLHLPTGEVELLLLASDNSMTKHNRFRIQNYSMRPLSNKEFEATRAKNEKQIVRSVAIEFRNHIVKAGMLPLTRVVCKNSNNEVIQTNIPIFKVTVASQDCLESFEVSNGLLSSPEKIVPNGHLSFPDKIVKKLATVAGRYTISLEPAAGQTPFTCEPATFYITPAEMHKTRLGL
ncbi:hypothetical protein GUITHDRAFT_142220 [Guillardia theta CCMP2712]|uniref:SMCHD1 ribosomal S5 domain-containing protein n=1 Tax=Guillardia theta (strain CCMP2712) TaxID=905079 RepID=L1IXT2_GUITC|nr:hypothetical protein GUITHDRAFT_142220 [Guillardia theta CCMP2712]EKX41046.1 hypothetical protein GUITHDRAFT_142220 [Guillardia theta CCMP2712]|eukprot:XP_005828026.1 hypothetical protein GUITHDRAFT_142220 [Guillardia theta CCMP2712]